MTNKLIAQDAVHLKQFALNSNTVQKGSYSEEILISLALANAKDLKNTEFVINYNIENKLLIVDGQSVDVSITINGFVYEGDVEFRDFSVVNKLKPDFASVKIYIHNNGEIIKSEIVEVPISQKAGRFIIDLDNTINITSAKITAFVIGFTYSETTFKNFMVYAKLINSYYGFSSLLAGLNESFRGYSLKSNEDVSMVFLHWHETARVFSLVGALHLAEALNLKKFDPDNLVKKEKELARYYRRSTTLLNKNLLAELQIGFTADKQKYISGLVELSNKYYKKSKTLQPFLSVNYFDAIAINKQAGELEVIKRISEYYDLFAYGDQIIVPIALNGLFVEDAGEYLNDSKNNMALQQLKNAQIIQEYFNLPQSDIYSATLALTLNGMIESYLRVSDKAFRSGNFAMAENYYQNAEIVFNENIELFKETDITATPFSIYLQTQRVLAVQLLAESKYEEAEKLFENCQRIIKEKNLIQNTEETALLARARNGVFKNKIIAAKKQLQNNNVDEALAIIYDAASYCSEHAEVVGNKELDDLSYSVFIEYLQKAEILMDKDDYNEAMAKLLKAKEIQLTLLTYEVSRLDELLVNASVPVILEKLDEAGFYTWAKKPEEANLLLLQAKEIQQTYHQQENRELNEAIQSLKYKMKNRLCMDAEFSLRKNLKLIVKEIEKGDFEKAKQTVTLSFSLVDANAECELDLAKLDSICKYYNFVFSFYDNYNLMKTSLFDKGYLETINLYIKLRNTYFEDKIGDFNFELPSLYEFVKSQKLTGLTEGSIRYFISSEQYRLAFDYLYLLKQQGVSPSDCKEMQIELGMCFSSLFEGEEAKKNMIEELAVEDKWFKYFINAMNKK